MRTTTTLYLRVFRPFSLEYGLRSCFFCIFVASSRSISSSSPPHALRAHTVLTRLRPQINGRNPRFSNHISESTLPVAPESRILATHRGVLGPACAARFWPAMLRRRSSRICTPPLQMLQLPRQHRAELTLAFTFCTRLLCFSLTTRTQDPSSTH